MNQTFDTLYGSSDLSKPSNVDDLDDDKEGEDEEGEDEEFVPVWVKEFDRDFEVDFDYEVPDGDVDFRTVMRGLKHPDFQEGTSGGNTFPIEHQKRSYYSKWAAAFKLAMTKEVIKKGDKYVLSKKGPTVKEVVGMYIDEATRQGMVPPIGNTAEVQGQVRQRALHIVNRYKQKLNDTYLWQYLWLFVNVWKGEEIDHDLIDAIALSGPEVQADLYQAFQEHKKARDDARTQPG